MTKRRPVAVPLWRVMPAEELRPLLAQLVIMVGGDVMAEDHRLRREAIANRAAGYEARRRAG